MSYSAYFPVLVLQDVPGHTEFHDESYMYAIFFFFSLQCCLIILEGELA